MLDTAIIGDLLLSDVDFPDTFVNRIHPDDLKEVDQPGTNEVIVNRYPHHHRFLVRYVVFVVISLELICWYLDCGSKLGTTNTYQPLSCVILVLHYQCTWGHPHQVLCEVQVCSITFSNIYTLFLTFILLIGVIVDDGNGYDTIQLNFQQHALQRRLVISETPQPHAPANIIGISLLTRMGMRIFLDAQDNDAASFDNLPIIQ